MQATQPKARFEKDISDAVIENHTLTRDVAEKLFTYFQKCKLFRWKDTNNDCEDRANAISILLDQWKIPNYKAWVFSGFFLKKEMGGLIKGWNYHVAPLLPVEEDEVIRYYVMDPSTLSCLETIEAWAANITEIPWSYYLVKKSEYYIFTSGKITGDNWHKRNRQNYKWTIQGLSGINGVSRIGKAQVCFNKSRIQKTEAALKELINNKPLHIR